MIELGIERERSDSKKNEGDVRVHQEIEDLFLERHAKRNNGLAGKLEGGFLTVEALEGFALHLPEKIGLAGGDVVDQVLRENFLLGERLRLDHSADCYITIPPSF